MPQLPRPIDPNDYSDMRDFTPVPPGKYIAAIVNSEVRDTSTGGKMLVLYFNILAGPYTGKGFVTRLNLQNANPAAVKMANEEFSTILRACRLGPQTKSEPLHNKAMVVTLTLIPGDGQYGPKNEPTFYATTEGYDRDTIPVNPEPDETTLAIIAGTKTSAGSDSSKAPATQTDTKVPETPAGFGEPTLTPPAGFGEKPLTPPAGFGEPAAPEPAPEPAAPDITAAPPW